MDDVRTDINAHRGEDQRAPPLPLPAPLVRDDVRAHERPSIPIHQRTPIRLGDTLGSASGYPEGYVSKVEKGTVMPMDRERPPLLWVILHEGCLRARIGGPDVMRAQIEHLISEVEMCPHLTLQVLPIDAGAPPATESFTVLKFSHRSAIAYVDPTFTGQVIESAATVDAKETYDRLRAAALHPNESVSVMRKIMKEVS